MHVKKGFTLYVIISTAFLRVGASSSMFLSEFHNSQTLIKKTEAQQKYVAVLQDIISSSPTRVCSCTFFLSGLKKYLDLFSALRHSRPVILYDLDAEAKSCDIQYCTAVILDLQTHGAELDQAISFLLYCGLRAFPSVPVIVVLSALSSENFKEQVERLMLTPSLANTMDLFFLVSDQSEHVDIYRRCLYCNSGQPKISKIPPNIGQETSKLNKIILFPDELTNFYGHQFQVVSMDWPPLVTFSSYQIKGGQVQILQDCLDRRIIEAISESLNFTYELRTPVDQQWGVFNESTNGWTGSTGTLISEDADFSLILSWTHDRYSFIDYVRIYTSEPLVIATKKAPFAAMYLAIVRPLDGIVWGLLILSVLMFGLVIYFTGRIWASATEKETGMSLSTSFLHVWGIMMECVIPFEPQNETVRVSIIFWSLFCMLMMTIYKSSLTANLSVPKTMRTLDTLEDLVRNIEVYTFGYEPTYGSGWDWLKNNDNPVVKASFDVIEVQSLEQNIKKVLQGGHMFLSWEYYIRVIVSAQYTDVYGDSPVHLSRKKYFSYGGYGWGVRKGAPFRHKLDMNLQRLIEAGLVQYWLHDLITQSGRSQRSDYIRGRKIRMKSGNMTVIDKLFHIKQIQRGEVKLGLKHVQGAFYLLGFGSGISLVFFLTEVINRKRGRRKQ